MRTYSDSVKTIILKLGGYVEMQIFGRLFRAERDPATLGDLWASMLALAGFIVLRDDRWKYFPML